MKNTMKSSKLAKKANALKGFMNSMSMKKGQEGFIKKDSKEPISFNYKAKYKGDKQILKGTSPEGNYKTKRVSEFMSPGIQDRYLGPATVKETARRTMKGMLQGAEKPVKSSMKKGGSFPDLNKDGEITKADILMGRGVINKPKAQMGMNIKKETLKNATPSIPNSYYQTGGTYMSFKNGRVGRTYPLYKDMVEYKSMDTTGYSKGKKSFDLTTSRSGAKINSEKISRDKVPSTINSLKKGATRTETFQMGGMKEQNPLSGMLKESMKEKAMAKKKAMAKSMPKPKKKMGMGGGPPNAFGIGIQPLMASKYQDDTLMGQSLKKGGMIKKKKK